MKCFRTLATFTLVAGISAITFAGDLAWDVAKANDAQPKFQKVKSEIVFKIYGRDGKVKFTKRMAMAQYVQNQGTAQEVENSMAAFLEPADEQGNSFLAYNYKNQSDEKFVYLKGIKKAKKVAGATRKSPFFGSDFNNDDMGYPDINEYNFKILRNEKISFKGKDLDCQVVEMSPKSDAIKSEMGYGKKISWVYKVNDKSYLTPKLEFYDTDGTLLKVMTLATFVAKNNAKGELVIFTTGLDMKNVKTGTWTEFRIENLKVEGEANVDPKIFSEMYLDRKWW